MSDTYTSSETAVNNGDTTIYTVPSEHDTPTSAKVRWQGKTNFNAYIDGGTVENNYQSAIASQTEGSKISVSGEAPQAPSNATNIEGVDYSVRATNHSDKTISLTASDDNNSVSITGDVIVFNGSYTSDSFVGDSPEYWGGSEGSPVTAYAHHNEIGETHEIRAELETRTEWSERDDIPTQNPSVEIGENGSTASYSGSISDGSWTSWQSIGMVSGQNTFNHSIGGSNKADFQFEYTYATTPDAQYTYRVTINGTVYDSAIANTSDSALQYDSVRVAIAGNTYCYDVVDPDDPDALPYYFYHPNHGKLALREMK